MLIKLVRIYLIFGMCCLGLMRSPASALDLELAGILGKQLGVSQDQATGGAGAVFQLAKQKLSSQDFSSIAKVVPGMDTYLGAAPKPKKSSGALGGLTSLAGGGSSKLSTLTSLAGSFKQLGMSGDMVGKFTPLILDYVQNKGGEKAMQLLQGALK